MDKSKISALHKGHRQRLKNRYSKEGISSFQEHELLELLLFFAIPYKDTNQLAHELINNFGSMPNVLNAPPESLKAFKNMTGNAALLLNLVNDISNKYYMTKPYPPQNINSPQKLKAFLEEKYKNIDKEVVYLLLIDKQNRVIDCIKMNEGFNRVSEVKIGEIAKIAHIRNISRIILVHNHPDSSPVSTNDVVSTKKIAYHLNSIDIELCESYVLTNNKLVGIIDMLNKSSKLK